MSKFRKKPVVIEAVQWTGANVQAVAEFLAGADLLVSRTPTEGDILKRDHHDAFHRIASFDLAVTPPTLAIPTLEGTMTAISGDWIIRGVKGEFYPCNPDIFAATYEPVDDASTTLPTGEG
jgi:hypothetical protein